MTSHPMVAGPEPFALVMALLLAGAVLGWGGQVAHRLRGVDPARARTVAMRGALTCAIAASLIILATAVWQLTSCSVGRAGAECARSVTVLALPAPVKGVPGLDLSVRNDGLSALFLFLVGFCGTCIAVYSFGWLRRDALRSSVAGSFNAFLAATVFAIEVNNVFWLLVALELVTLCSVDLVRYGGRTRGSSTESRTAVRTYLLVSHVGLMCLVAGLLPVVVGRSALDFDALRSTGGSPVPALSFCLVLLGLAVRAGVAPFHFWVPTVHPQLPTNTHAMMSAVMLKVPIYLMIRFFLEGMLGPVAWWWGAVVLVLAGLTTVVTVFYALLSKDLKRALAYHSLENIGIILAGLGLALLFSDPHYATPAMRAAAALALLASLYHVVNHALFKSLLFLGTASIERLTGTVEPGKLGGVLRQAPWTATTFLVGAMAIAALPPLNGFTSEWLTFQALFGGQSIYRVAAPVALASMVALTFALVALATAVALTALAFVKICGEALLGEARSAVQRSGETRSMRAVLVVLSLACLALGLQPWLLVPWLSTALAPLHYDVSVLSASPSAVTIELPGAPARDATAALVPYQATLPTWPLLLLAGLPVLLIGLLRVRRWVRRPVWAGGRPFVAQTMRYPGSAASALLWEPVSRESPPPAATLFPVAFELSPRRSVLEVTNHLYNRLIVRISTASEAFGRWLQNGDIRNYLLYVFAAVLLVLLAVIPQWVPP